MSSIPCVEQDSRCKGKQDNDQSRYADAEEYTLMQNVLRPVRPQDTWNVEIDGSFLLALNNAHNVEGVAKFADYGRRTSDTGGELLHTFGLSRLKDVTSEHKDLEARVGWTKVLDFDRSAVGRVKNNLRWETLTDNQFCCVARSLAWVGCSDDGWGILHSHSGRKTTIFMECSKNVVIKCEVLRKQTKPFCKDILKLLWRGLSLILQELRSSLDGEACLVQPIEPDQVLSEFKPLEFVL